MEIRNGGKSVKGLKRRNRIKRLKKILFCSVLLAFSGAVLPVTGGGPFPVTAYAGPLSFFGDMWQRIVNTISEGIIRKDAKYPVTSWYDGEEINGSGTLPDTRESSASMIIGIIDDAAAKAYDYHYSRIAEEAASLGYDTETTLESYESLGNVLGGIDYAYFLSVFSLRYPDNEITAARLRSDLEAVIPDLISIDYTGTETVQYEAVPWYRYEEVTVTVCSESYGIIGYEEEVPVDTDGDGIEDGTEGGEPVYGYMHQPKEEEFYVIERDGNGDPVVDFMIYQEEGKEVPAYEPVSVRVFDPGADGDSECPVVEDEYYVIGEGDDGSGMKRVYPVTQRTVYGKVSAVPFTNEGLWDILGIDRDEKFFHQMSEKTVDAAGHPAPAPEFDIGPTNYEMAQIRYEMFGELYPAALTAALTDYRAGLSAEEIRAYLDALPAGTSGNRRQVIKTALSVVNQLPYCNNGEDSKPGGPGYDPSWYDYSRCDGAGRPSGLDSSGFIQWVFWTAGFSEEEVACLRTASLISNKVEEIRDPAELKPGDIGIVTLAETSEKTEGYSRCGIFLGDGRWIVNSGEEGTVIVSTSENFGSLKVFSPRMEEDDLFTDEIVFHAAGTAGLGGDGSEATLYTICQIILQECDDEKNGTLAVAECVKNRAVDRTEFAGVNTAWEVLTQKGQFEAYSSGAYRNRRPSESVMTRIRQVFDGKLTALNNVHVLYFVSKAYHEAHYGEPGNFRNRLSVFGCFGGNVYYIDPIYQGKNGVSTGTGIYTTAALDVGSYSIPANGSCNPVVYMAQGDFKDVAYGSGNVAGCGCGVVCCAMAVSYCTAGTERSRWTGPAAVLERIAAHNGGDRNAYYTWGAGSNHDIASAVADYYGLHHTGVIVPQSMTENEVLRRLRSGQVAVCSCGSGIFTDKGHFIMITGCDSRGFIYVNDPNGKHASYSGNGYTWNALISQTGSKSLRGNLTSMVFLWK